MRDPAAARPAERNPYRPTPSATPLVFAGRDHDLAFLIDRLNDAPEIPADVRLTGSRGMGKTVLLKRFGQEAEERGWVYIPIDLDRRFNYEGELVALLSTVSRRKAETLSVLAAARRIVAGAAAVALASINVTIGDISASLDPKFGDGAVDLERSLTDVVQTAIRVGKVGCLFTLDEAQLLLDDPASDEYPLSLLLAMFSGLQLAGWPIALVLSGVPALDKNVGQARPQSERLFRELRIGLLGHDAAEEALTGPLRGTSVTCTPAAVDLVLPLIGGYPHFVQVFGAELWTAAQAHGVRLIGVHLVRETLPVIEARIEGDIYDFRMRQLDPAERDLLIASAGLSTPPIRAAQLVTQQLTLPEVDAMLAHLLELGVLSDPADRSEYVYTVPGFHDYLLRRGAAWTSMPRPGT